VLGDDSAGGNVVRMLAELGVESGGIARTGGRMTSSKSRFSALNQQVLRFDEEEVRALTSA
jgi:D-beta-D-heptose 7-phosphate kinase/D-beta-D-heptose 1-phosphate adenosyltransferase